MSSDNHTVRAKPGNARVPRTGERFGRWTVLEEPFIDDSQCRSSVLQVLCRCDCGTERNLACHSLIYDRSHSCGCLTAEKAGKRATVHGGSKSRLYKTWENMVTRCTNPSNRGWAMYGGRGITICDEWRAFAGFQAWAMTSGYRDDLTIERKDVDGGYCPDNCEWILLPAQAENRQDTHRITAFGETKSRQAWTRDPRCVVSEGAIRHRLRNLGWDAETALTSPPDSNRDRIGRSKYAPGETYKRPRS